MSSVPADKMRKLDNLTKDKLVGLYIKESKSFEDIAKIYNVSGVAVYKKLKKFGIPQRSKSEAFIVGLQRTLEDLGMPKRTIYKQKTKNGWSYMFIYEHKDSVKLFNILYKNTQNGLFLERKYKRFLEGLREV